MLYFKNILLNALKVKYFSVTIKKFIKKFDKDTSIEALKWSRSNTKFTTEQFCRLIDQNLYEEVSFEIKSIENEAKTKLSKLDVTLGGGGNYILLYFLIRKFNLINIVETGVAAGWSSLAILKAFKKNGKGKLYSSDFPYYRLKNPEQYIGYLAKDEINKKDWYLNINGDDVALPEILEKLEDNSVDLIHYDSDKSYYARNKALKIFESKISSKTIIIFDDIQDNLHFKDLVNKMKESYCVIEFQNKYLGIIGINLPLSK